MGRRQGIGRFANQLPAVTLEAIFHGLFEVKELNPEPHGFT
jgi:hypothetical protein